MRVLLKENYKWIERIYCIKLHNLILQSACNIKEEGIKFLQSLLGNFDLMPLYRASEDGWLASDFHQKCDKKGATISLI